MHNRMTRPHKSQCLWSAQPQGQQSLANFAGSFIAVAAIPCSPVMSQLSAMPDITVNRGSVMSKNNIQHIEK